MKTEPMEALKFLYSVEDPTDNIPMHLTPKDKADHVCRLAFKEGQSNPKIRQLEWDFHGLYYQAQMPIACYVIYPSYTDDHLCVLDINDIAVKFNITLNEAKEAAQLDFEERILKCLEIML